MGLFSKKVTPHQTFDSRTPERQQIDQFLANFVSTYGKQYQPGKAYQGTLTAGASPYERRGLEEFLTSYLNEPGVTPNLAASQEMLGETLTGGFDPGSSPYYRALREEAQLNRQGAIDQLNADLGGRGKFFSSEALSKTGDINEATATFLNRILAELAERERGRQFQAVPLASNLEEYLKAIPLKKAQAATTIGAIPRMLEQADYEALYQDFLRRQGELGRVTNAGAGVTSNLDVIPGSRQKSTFESFVVPLLSQAIPALLTAGQSLPFTAGASAIQGATGGVPISSWWGGGA